MKNKSKYLFSGGRFRPTTSFNASTMMQAFNYGTAAFEGLRAYYQKKEKSWLIFRADEHYSRLRKSASMIDINVDFDQQYFVNILSKLIKKNNVRCDVYLRPLVYCNACGIGHDKPSDYDLSIFMEPMPFKPQKYYSCCLVTPRRPVDGTYNVKLSGNYLLSFFAQKEAVKKGCDFGLLLSSDGFISETSVMNIFFIKRGRVFTPSIKCGCLEGITRKSVMQIFKDVLGVKVREGKYRTNRLLQADEIILTGTGSGINLVSEVEGKHIQYSNSNNYGQRIYQIYRDIIRDRRSEFRHWLFPV